MKIVVIDGQGGRIGSLLTGRLCKEQLPNCELYAIGTNATATAAMLKAGLTSAQPEKIPCLLPAGMRILSSVPSVFCPQTPCLGK